jgi:Na+/proline symporter
LQADDPQKILPSLVMEHMPLWLQVMFFGALLSAIMSTASATLLAPATTFVENILKNLRPLTDRSAAALDAPDRLCVRRLRADLFDHHGRHADL